MPSHSSLSLAVPDLHVPGSSSPMRQHGIKQVYQQCHLTVPYLSQSLISTMPLSIPLRRQLGIEQFWRKNVHTPLCLSQPCPHGLTFTWWGCCGLCLSHKPTELVYSFLFCSCVCFCLYGPFNCIPFHKFSRQLFAFSLFSSGFISAFQLYISLRETPPALIESLVLD